MSLLLRLAAELFQVRCRSSLYHDFFSIKRKFQPVIFGYSESTKPACRKIDRILLSIFAGIPSCLPGHNFHDTLFHFLISFLFKYIILAANIQVIDSIFLRILMDASLFLFSE